jgi:hypothetical protein
LERLQSYAASGDSSDRPAQRGRRGPFYAYGNTELPYIVGARIELDYDPTPIEAAPTTIEVLAPDGQKVETTFDLGQLR